MELNKKTLRECINGEKDAQKALYHITLPYMRAVCSRYVYDQSYVKDVLQEGYINVFNKIGTYNPSKAPLKSWITRIFINICINYNERVIKRSYIDIEELESYTIMNLPVDVKSVSIDQLIAIIKLMPVQYHEVFNMYVIEGYTHREIADFLGITETLSRKRLSRGREWIKNRFMDNAAVINKATILKLKI